MIRIEKKNGMTHQDIVIDVSGRSEEEETIDVARIHRVSVSSVLKVA